MRQLLIAFVALAVAAEADPALPPGDKRPILRLEAGGPTSFVTALAFDPRSGVLHVAGWDKVVRRYARAADDRLALDAVSYRVPVGPELQGAINAIALSDDGRYLAVAGRGVVRTEATFRQNGRVWPSDGVLTPTMREDVGLIYVFDTTNRAVTLLRGHTDAVESLAFAPPPAGRRPLLVSVDRSGGGAREQFASARVWDTTAGRSLAVLDRFADITGLPRPDLAVWRTGPEPLALRVALACSDKQLRIWQPTTNTVTRADDTVNSGIVLRRRDRDQLITVSPGPRGVRPRTWALGPPLSTTPLATIAVDTYAWAGALVSRGDAEPLLAVAISDAATSNRTYRLLLTDLSGRSRADVPLWTGSPKQPTLTTSPDGALIAVAGNEDHTVSVFATADVLAGRVRPQVLRGVGQTFHKVDFVRNGERSGLRLSQPGSVVFDVTGRTLAEPDGWQSANAVAAGWTATLTQVDIAKGRIRAEIAIQGDGRATTVRGPVGYEVSAYALTPPREGRPALIAIASHVRGQPRLAIYDAATGTELRWYTGHSDRLYAVAFSADGRLLASVGEDQVACVYSLTDLDLVIGKRGRIPGLVVKPADKGVAVLRLTDECPLREQLKANENITAVQVGERRELVSTPREFYIAVEKLLPGTRAALVRPAGALPVVIGQGVDERKPLFSLFVGRPNADGFRGWIGWNPLGPYDRSAPLAERFIGWHFNTGDPAGPTRFATADQYRDAYYREGILSQLLADGTLRQVPPAQRPKPQMGLKLRDIAAPDANARILSDRPAVTLDLDVTNRPVSTLGRVTWELNNGPAREMVAGRGEDRGSWSADLQLKRGPNRVRVTVRTLDEQPVEVSQEFTAIYQPPPPTLQVAGGVRPRLLRRNQFDLSASVTPGVEGEPVRVTLRQWHDGEPIFEGELPIEDGQVSRRLDLRPGQNVIELSAGYPGDDTGEPARQSFQVTYVRASPPPVVTLDALRGPDGVLTAMDPARPTRVADEEVRLIGRIEAKEPLAEATLKRNDGQPKPLSGFMPGKSLTLAVDEALILKPGRQTLTLRTRAATGDPAESVIVLEFQPPVPEPVMMTSDDTTVTGDTATTVVTLNARLRGSLERPFTTMLLLDGQPTTIRPTINNEAATLTVEVPLTPGRHQLRLRTANEWGSAAESASIAIRYARPPKILAVEAQADGSAARLTAQVRSPIPLTDLSVTVNGQSRGVKPMTTDNGDGTFTVRITGVDLEAGRERHELALMARNGDGPALAAGRAVVLVARAEPPPEIDFLLPSRDTTTSDRVTVSFRVRSASPLTSVRLVPATGEALVADLTKTARSPAAAHELTVSLEVPLREGVNPLRAEAVNAGGQRQALFPINRLEPPVRIVVERLEPADGSPPIDARPLPGGEVAFDTVPSGRARLIGRLVWGRAAPPDQRPDVRVRVFVNGFQRLPAIPLWDDGDDRMTPFRADLVFGKDHANAVKLQLDGGGQDTSDRNEFVVDCRQPIEQQRLHLLIVSTRSQDREALRRRVLESVGSAPAGPGGTKTAAFERVLTYGPLADPDRIGPAFVDGQLAFIRGAIRTFDRTGRPGNDVIMVYVEGGEAVGAGGNIFRAAGVGAGLAVDQLISTLGRTPGAAVVMVDVERHGPARPGADKVARWGEFYAPDNPHVGSVRYLWNADAAGAPSVRLLPTLRQALPEEKQFGPVTLLIGRLAEANRSLPGWLSYERFVPGDLGGLALAGVGGE